MAKDRKTPKLKPLPEPGARKTLGQDEASAVRGGRKAGEGQKDFLK